MLPDQCQQEKVLEKSFKSDRLFIWLNDAMHGGHADKEDWKHANLNKKAMSFEAAEIFIQTSLEAIKQGWLAKGAVECKTCVENIFGHMGLYTEQVMRRFTLYLRIGLDKKDSTIPRKMQNLKELIIDLEKVSKNDTTLLYDAVTQTQHLPALEVVPRWPMFVHALSGIIQMGASAYYHLFQCVDEETHLKLQKFDFGAISIMIAGTTTSPFYYGFMCEQMTYYRHLYLGIVWVSCIVAAAVTIIPRKQNIIIVLIADLIAGWSTVPGIIHLAFYSDPKYVPAWDYVPWVVGGLMTTVGAITYGLKFPEKCFKRKFDNFGSSHQIFHICVFTGSFIHVWASIKGFHER